MSTLRDDLRSALTAAMRAHDKTAVRAVRGAMSALANAEAVVPSPDSPGGSRGSRGLAIEQSPVGPGAAEVPRRELTEADEIAVVRAEVDALRGAAEQMRATSPDHADESAAQARVLAELLAGLPGRGSVGGSVGVA